MRRDNSVWESSQLTFYIPGNKHICVGCESGKPTALRSLPIKQLYTMKACHLPNYVRITALYELGMRYGN